MNENELPIIVLTPSETARISNVEGMNKFSFSFYSPTDIVEYKVKLVNSIDSLHDDGESILDNSGSENTYGENIDSHNEIFVTITAADLEQAGAIEDGLHTIKVFIKDKNDNWSI